MSVISRALSEGKVSGVYALDATPSERSEALSVCRLFPGTGVWAFTEVLNRTETSRSIQISITVIAHRKCGLKCMRKYRECLFAVRELGSVMLKVYYKSKS